MGSRYFLFAILCVWLTACGRQPAHDGLFSGKYGVVNTASPSFNEYYRVHPDNDTSYIAPRRYIPPTRYNPSDSPALQEYYRNPTDADASYVPPRAPQTKPLDSRAMQEYYRNPVDNDASYVPPRSSGLPKDQQRYPDHDEDYYPMIYDY